MCDVRDVYDCVCVCVCVCPCRTWGHLLYVSKDAFSHFREVMKRYHSVTHRGGAIYVDSNSAILDMRNKILSSVCLKKQFKQFTNLNDKYIDRVFDRYVRRCARMQECELERNSIENLKRSGGSLEQLRQVKGDVNSNKKIKLM